MTFIRLTQKRKSPAGCEALCSLPLPGVATLMPLSCCRPLAAYNRYALALRCFTGIPFSLLTLTSGMSQFGPASGSLVETRGHIMTVAYKCGLSVLLAHNSTLQKRKSPAIFSQGHHVILSSLPPSTIQVAYQSRLKYGLFSSVLQDLHVNLLPFVVNVIGKLKSETAYPVQKICEP